MEQEEDARREGLQVSRLSEADRPHCGSWRSRFWRS